MKEQRWIEEIEIQETFRKVAIWGLTPILYISGFFKVMTDPYFLKA